MFSAFSWGIGLVRTMGRENIGCVQGGEFDVGTRSLWRKGDRLVALIFVTVG